MASTLLHLILLNFGGCGGAVAARPEVTSDAMHVRLVGADPALTGPEAGRAAPAPEPDLETWRPKEGGAASSGPPARREETRAGNSDYFAKAYLTVNPEPLSAVEIRPPEIGGKGTVQLELSLFIDEEGKVRRVRAETPGAMEAYVDAATQAFEATRFKPGEISGRAVKSVIRVVVEFEQP